MQTGRRMHVPYASTFQYTNTAKSTILSDIMYKYITISYLFHMKSCLLKHDVV